jgi:hypothetical protein
LYNNLLALLARYQKALDEISRAETKLIQLQGDAESANQDIAEGYEDQNLGLMGRGDDLWKEVYKDWPAAMKRYKGAFETAVKTRDDLVGQRTAFQRMCPGIEPPQIPDLPEKEDFRLPPEAGNE